MTTAFILALIAAGGVSVVLIAAINYIRRLERDNAWLMRIIGELNEEQAKLCKELEVEREKRPPVMEFSRATPNGVKRVLVNGVPYRGGEEQ